MMDESHGIYGKVVRGVINVHAAASDQPVMQCMRHMRDVGLGLAAVEVCDGLAWPSSEGSKRACTLYPTSVIRYCDSDASPSQMTFMG